ncbi:MAG: adenylate/guanylate cyclase domain-containing protein [Patescibacteria group bacterium]|nr:adenylate/guanylate cyclase domain-containing protein [Patescibacteria group bacterium]MDE2437846.1 adenylate/guanylate cyclase domain-containing protein [Patescibacteria group bacterium]
MKQERISFFIIGLCVGIVTLISLWAGFFTGFEHIFEDLLITTKPFSDSIVLVTIDNSSLATLGQWPWPRAFFAQALTTLENVHPKAVGLDVAFSEASRLGSADDEALAGILKNLSYPLVLPLESNGALHLGYTPPRVDSLLTPLPLFTDNTHTSLGDVHLVPDVDGVVRRFAPRIEVGGNATEQYNSFGYEVAQQARLPVSPLPNDATLRIVYAASTGHIQRIPFSRIIDNDPTALSLLKNKIILIGATAPDLHDEQRTPSSGGSNMSGVEIQANILNMILLGYRETNLPFFPASMILFFVALIPALVFTLLKGAIKPLLVNVALGVIYLIIIVLLFEQGIVVNLVHVSLAWILSSLSLFVYRYFRVEREKREVQKIFSKYVSSDVLNLILEHPEHVALGGEEKEITVLFTDIRGFTTISEATSPQDLVQLLNRYFSAMTEVVLKNKGLLNQYIGDAIMAFWGAPVNDPDQADHAVETGFEMLERLHILNEEFTREGKPAIHIGVGIYTGPAVIGNIGSEVRLEYTAIGDTVNVASRFEGLNKKYESSIIIGETTKEKLKHDYQFKFLDTTEVKGRKEALRVYTVERSLE